MKILIFSDIHYEAEPLMSAIRENRDAEYVLFLGDGLSQLEDAAKEFPYTAFVAVRGNCDLFSIGTRFNDCPLVKVLTIDNIRIFMCHGHTLNLDMLAYTAAQNGATVALFGHTHQTYHEICKLSDGREITLFNPGTIGAPRNDPRFTYGIMEIKNGTFKLAHKTQKTL